MLLYVCGFASLPLLVPDAVDICFGLLTVVGDALSSHLTTL